jgi:8-amino-7-oxononanoate synthase
MLISDELALLAEQNLLRSLAQPTGIDFLSNNYLGLAQNPTLRKRLIDFLSTSDSFSSTGSRLVSGNSAFIEDSEAFIATAFGAEAALFFGSGYLANLGVISAFKSASTEFFSDKYNHASIIDALYLSKSPVKIFKHNNLNHLEDLLLNSKAARKIIVTETIFSMEGDRAPLDELAQLAQRFDAYLIIDEAHSTGLAGPKVLALSTNILRDKVVSIHPCGKALGAYGAFICSSKVLRDYFINRARTFIFATAPAPLLIAHCRFAVELLMAEAQHYEALKENILLSQTYFQKLGLPHSASHIVPLIVGPSQKALNLAAFLQKAGIACSAIRYPSVQKDSARLRLTIKSFHSQSDIELLVTLLQEAQDAHLC